MLHKGAVDEDVATADAVVGRPVYIEELDDVVKRHGSVREKDQAEGAAFGNRSQADQATGKQPDTKPDKP